MSSIKKVRRRRHTNKNLFNLKKPAAGAGKKNVFFGEVKLSFVSCKVVTPEEIHNNAEGWNAKKIRTFMKRSFAKAAYDSWWPHHGSGVRDFGIGGLWNLVTPPVLYWPHHKYLVARRR